MAIGHLKCTGLIESKLKFDTVLLNLSLATGRCCENSGDLTNLPLALEQSLLGPECGVQ